MRIVRRVLQGGIMSVGANGRLRVAMLAGASVAALTALGGAGVARACVPSLQTISGQTAGPIVSNGGAITVTGSGSVNGGPTGVAALNCSITTLTNIGSIGGGAGVTSGPGG